MPRIIKKTRAVRKAKRLAGSGAILLAAEWDGAEAEAGK